MKRFIKIHQISETVMLYNVGVVYALVLLALFFKPVSFLLAVALYALFHTTMVCAILTLIYLGKVMNEGMDIMVNRYVEQLKKQN
jgi:hypothetical protein